MKKSGVLFSVAIKLLVPAMVFSIWNFISIVKINVNQACFILGNGDVSFVRGYLVGFGPWGPLASTGLMMLQSLIPPLSHHVVIFANAELWGWPAGALLSWIGMIAGSCLCFGISRFFTFDLRSAGFPISDRLPRVLNRKNATPLLIMARLLPFMPFDIVSYACGLSSISARSFIIGTSLGSLPQILVYAFVGKKLHGMPMLIYNTVLPCVALAIGIGILCRESRKTQFK